MGPTVSLALVKVAVAYDSIFIGYTISKVMNIPKHVSEIVSPK